MARYIDAEILVNGINNRVTNSLIRGWLASIIDETPTADVVEVVRCKDCVAGEKTTLEPFVCSRNKMLVYNNSYCSYGKRKCD